MEMDEQKKNEYKEMIKQRNNKQGNKNVQDY